MIEGVVLVVAVIVAGWAGYRTGWEDRGRRIGALGKAEEQAWTELNLIFLVRDDLELARTDVQYGTNALGRLRSMSPEDLAEFREGRGALYEGLSERLTVLGKRVEFAKAQMADYPLLAQLFRRQAGAP